MKTLKFTFILLLSFAFILKPERFALEICAGYDPDAYWAYQFFEPMSFEAMSNFEWQADSTVDANLQDWKSYLQGKPKEADIKEIVYGVSADDMQKIRAYIQNNASLPSNLKNNSLIKYWANNKDLEAIDYLYYAKVCEPEAQHYDNWDNKKRDVNKMKWLADAGKQYYNEKASNDFLRLRFAYQAVRMAHYTNQFDKAIRWYDELVQPLFEKSNSIIKYWALSLKAGALQNSKKVGEAAYLFSLVFDKCESRRASSFLSFKIESDSEWKQALNLCQNEEEKATLYFIRSLGSTSNGVEEIQNIYKIQPNSDKLSFMLVREINKLENSLLNTDLSKNLLFLTNTKEFSEKQALQNLKDLKSTVLKAINDKKVSRPDLWALANGYLNYLSGDISAALASFENISKQSSDLMLKKSAEIFRLALQISQLRNINDTMEEDIYKKVKATKHEHLKDFMVNAFGKLYQKQGEIGKSYLCYEDIYSLKVNPKMDVVENLIPWTDKSKMTDFETEVLIPKLGENKKMKNILLEIKATLLFAKDKLEEAIAIYQQIPEDVIYKIQENPFQVNIKDCWECPENTGKNKYNRLTLAQKILNLKKNAEKGTVEQANFYFQLGNAYYNMTHFGNAWMAVDYYRSSGDWIDSKDSQFQSFTNVDCSKAKFYFDRAMNVAIKNGDTELASQACYMAAKCEQNQFYLKASADVWGYIEPDFNPENRKYFTRLRDEFNQTKYYKTVINECRYFNVFVSK